jgi:hypothetical protein
VRSFSASATKRCKTNGSTSFDDQKRYPLHHQPAHEGHVAAEVIDLGDLEMALVLLRVRERGSELRTAVQGASWPPPESTSTDL